MKRVLMVLFLSIVCIVTMGQSYNVPFSPRAAGGGTVTLANQTVGVSVGDATSVTINKPSGCQDGDVLVAFLTRPDNDVLGAPGDTTHPWVLVDQNDTSSGDDISTGIWYKIIDSCAAESETDYTFTEASVPWPWIGFIVMLRGVHNTTPEDPTGGGYLHVLADDTPTGPTITTTVDNTFVLVFYGMFSAHGETDSDTPSGTTAIYDTFNASDPGALDALAGLSYFTQVSSGVTPAKTWTINGGGFDDADTMNYQVGFRPE